MWQHYEHFTAVLWVPVQGWQLFGKHDYMVSPSRDKQPIRCSFMELEFAFIVVCPVVTAFLKS
jgi:hypothetical protein